MKSTVRASGSVLRERDAIDVDEQMDTFSVTPTWPHTEKLCCSFLVDNCLAVNCFR